MRQELFMKNIVVVDELSEEEEEDQTTVIEAARKTRTNNKKEEKEESTEQVNVRKVTITMTTTDKELVGCNNICKNSNGFVFCSTRHG